MTDPAAEPVLAAIDHARFVADVRALGDALAGQPWRPHYLVGVGRGGLVPGTYLSHLTGIPLLSIDHSAGVPGFAGELMARLAALTREGRALLLVDDINDSGGTVATLRRLLEEAGAEPANVRVAVLIDNVRAASRVDFCARTIDRAHDKSWFVFPWEALAPRADLIEAARAEPGRLA